MKKKYYGQETGFAIENFKISKHRLQETYIKSLLEIKRAAAVASVALKVKQPKTANLIKKAIDELINDFDPSQYPLDVFQTGSGTSTNMNVNEVVANYASTDKVKIHPNDDVNWGQSSNCITPSALNVSNRILVDPLIEALKGLEATFTRIVKEQKDLIKIGRTHLQDAVPMTAGQEFSAFLEMIKQAIKNLESVKKHLEYIPIGGTAIGTGIASHPKFPKLVTEELTKRLGIKFKPSPNKFYAISLREEQTRLMNELSTICSSMIKIANDLRLLSSGPNTGFNEIEFAKLQAGSSVMPGKVNPVIMEMMIQVSAVIVGRAVSVNIGNQNGPLQLNLMLPMMAYLTIDSLEILTEAIKTFDKLGVQKISFNKKTINGYVMRSSAIVTVLKNHPKVGYDLASSWVKEAKEREMLIIDLIKEKKIFSEAELKKIFNFKKMV